MNNSTPKQTLNGILTSVYVGLDPNTFQTTRKDKVAVNFNGIEGDKHSGMTLLSGGRTPLYPRGTEILNDRQISVVSREDLETVSALMDIPEILPEWLGANLMIEGIANPGTLPPSTRLYFSGGVTLVVTAENHPCAGPGKVIMDHYGREGLDSLFIKSAMHRRGFVAMVEKPGVLIEGEEFKLIIPELGIYHISS
jgi:hypothetical protein